MSGELDGYEVDRRGWDGSGPHGATVDLLTLHYTEGPPGSLEGARSALHNNRAESTVLIEHRAGARGGRRAVQLVSADRAAKSLRNEAGGIQTNKGGTTQAEVVGYSADPVAGTTPADWRWLGAKLAVLAAWHRIPFVVAGGSRFYPYPPTRWSPPQYLGREFWRTITGLGPERGVTAHQRWRENSHGDPGDLTSPDPRLGGRSPWSLMVEGARGIIDTTPTTPTEETELMGITIEAIEAAAARAATKAVAPLAHAGKAVAARDNRDGKVWVVSGSGRFHARNRDVLNGLAMMGQLRPVDVDRIPVVDGARYIEPLPDLGILAGIADDIDELVDAAAANDADLDAEARNLIASLEALTGPDAMPVDALDPK